MFADRVQFSRQRLEFWYSLAVLLIIPLLIALNTLWLTIGLRSNFDAQLRSKANLANEVAGVGLAGQLNNPPAAQKTIDGIAGRRDDIRSLVLISASGGQTPEVIAASDKKLVGQAAQDQQIAVVLGTGQAIAREIKSGAERLQHVVTPLTDNSGKTVGALSSNVSSQAADAAIGSLLVRSLVVMAATIAVVILLLGNHFRFVEYAMLFRKLKELDQLKSDFLSVASHELKAPMTIIKGTIENINDGLLGEVSPKAKQSLGTVYEETDRLNNLVNDLLNVSRIEQGRISYKIEPVDISALTGRLVEQNRGRALKKGLQLTHQLPAQPAMVLADKDRVGEIMTNLIDNAIKYSHQGSIAISYKEADGKLRVSVRDTGIGMNAAEREKLFTRFYRVKNQKTSNISGTGLGLWIIQQYCQAMGGNIYVDSLEGVGSEFTVELPLASAASPAG